MWTNPKHERLRGGKQALAGRLVIAACDAAFDCIERARRLLGRAPVETIETEEIKHSLEQNATGIVLVDVRSEVERSVSMIPGSISRQEYEANPDGFADQTIVPYCTVGGRSYLYARQLVSAGVSAKNYRDSILGWCRAGGQLETQAGKSTQAVHPYWRIFDVPDEYEVRT